MDDCHCFYCSLSKGIANKFELDEADAWVMIFAYFQKENKRLGLSS